MIVYLKAIAEQEEMKGISISVARDELSGAEQSVFIRPMGGSNSHVDLSVRHTVVEHGRPVIRDNNCKLVRFYYDGREPEIL